MKFNRVRAFVRAVQKVLVTVLLFIVYVLGFGITSIFARIFNKDLFGRRDNGRNSFWGKATGYGRDGHDVTRQS
jgi:hypothetical protein